MHECKLCGHKIKNKENYRRHIKACNGNGTCIQQIKPPKKCEYCNKIFDKHSNYKRHVKYCKRIKDINLQEEYNSGLSMYQLVDKYNLTIKFVDNTLKDKRSISKAMAIKRKEQPEKFFYKGTKRISRGEKVFKQMIEDSIILHCYKIIEQYHLFGYRLDFAFPNIKLDVEIDGMQHYTKKEVRDKDKIRNEKLIKEGWTVYRIASKDFLARPQVVFKIFTDFLVSNFERQKIYVYKGQIIDGDKQWFKEREQKILNSNIEFHKLGWTIKLGKLLDVHSNTARRWVASNMPKFYKEQCYTPRADYIKNQRCS